MTPLADSSPGLWPLLAVALVGYVLGALPFGYWISKGRGVNIFEAGSRNPGATNVRRVLGAKAGNTVFALDAGKGAAAAGWPWVMVHMGMAGFAPWFGLLGLGSALIGHSFSCFTDFRGGKGVATVSGGLLVLMPLAALVCMLLWVVIFYASGYVSLASILAALSLPAAAWFLGYPGSSVVAAALVGMFVVVRHRANVRRLLNGTESRFRQKPAPEDGA